MPLRAGAKGHLACTLGLEAHDRGRAPGSRFPRRPFPRTRRPHRARRPRSSARPWVEVRPGLAAASGPPQLSFPTRAGCLPSASGDSSQQTDVPSGPDPPAEHRTDEGKGDCPRPPFISPSSTALQASPPSRPSVRPSLPPESSPVYPRARPRQRPVSPDPCPPRPGSRDAAAAAAAAAAELSPSCVEEEPRPPPCGEAGKEGGREATAAGEGGGRAAESAQPGGDIGGACTAGYGPR